jgi:hypothetical protein
MFTNQCCLADIRPVREGSASYVTHVLSVIFVKTGYLTGAL